MAVVPLPGAELTTPDLGASVPAAVHGVLRSLWDAGFAAYVVGGAIRDSLTGRRTTDWDVATSALPEQTQAVFPGATYENRFGTVAVRTDDPSMDEVEITTFRSDHDYADFRRPHRVEFSDDVLLDLARRDFTVNAMAWGAEPGAAPALLDPYAGQRDLESRTRRAVGVPSARFREDALRMLRAVRFAATLDATIEPATLQAITADADLASRLSGERIGAEMRRVLDAERPSVGLRLAQETGLLTAIAPDLALQRGVPQNKIPGEDLWDHTLRSVDGAAAHPPYLRAAALLHDIGKPATMADGRFLGHETVGGELADRLLERWRWPLAERQRIVGLVGNHMFGYVPTWSDAAVRRFIVKVGRDLLDDLFLLREADNVGSGLAAGAGDLPELRHRVAKQLDAGVALDLRALAVDGRDLMAVLDLPPGPLLGRLLDGLLDRVIADPSLNDRDVLLSLARRMLTGMAATHEGPQP